MIDFPKIPPSFFDIYKKIGSELRYSNRFSLPPDLSKICEDYLSWHINHKTKEVNNGTIFKRARINKADQIGAYNTENMGAPPKGLASPGRINPEGISYLYLADTAETAIAEVRPWKGAIVSVAEVEVHHKIKIVSLRRETITNAKGLDIDNHDDLKKIVRYTITSEILNQLYFSAPAHGDDKFAYLPSQYIAEMFKARGVDGIEYDSVLNADGKNLAIFNPDVARAISVSQYKINSVTYDSSLVKK